MSSVRDRGLSKSLLAGSKPGSGGRVGNARYRYYSCASRTAPMIVLGFICMMCLLVFDFMSTRYGRLSVGGGRVDEMSPVERLKLNEDLERLGISTNYPHHQIEVEAYNRDVSDEVDELAERRRDELERMIEQQARTTAMQDDSRSVPRNTELDGDNNNNNNNDNNVVVDELGGLMFSDGVQYEAAPELTRFDTMPEKEYKYMWSLLKLHEDFVRTSRHRAYIPHLVQEISRVEFHEIFRKTSTPVVIPFKFMRHLGVTTKAWTMSEMRKRFPYSPGPGMKVTSYSPKSGSKSGLDFGPALYAISNDAPLKKNGLRRNFPRNLMIKSKYLDALGVSRPPFVDRHRFQPPTLWLGTSSSDTKLHSDCCDNFVMMISGVKRWYLAAPTEARNLKPIKCEGANQSLCWASVKYPNDPKMSNQDKNKLNKLQPIVIDLHAGEMLYVPAGWWHHIENLGPTVMVNFWTLGCENVGLALDQDPMRTDRPDFVSCPAIAKKSKLYIEG